MVVGHKEKRLEVWAGPDGAWLQGHDGPKQIIDPAYAASLIRAQSPSHVLGSGMSRLWEVLDPELAPVLEADGIIDVSGKPCYLLRGQVGPSQTPIGLAFDTRRLRLRQVVIGEAANAWVLELSEYYEEVSGMNIPHAISVWFGGDILYQIDSVDLKLTFRDSTLARPVRSTP